MITKLHFDGAATSYKLTRAILIYESRGNDQACAATSHAIHEVAGKPMIEPGQPVTLAGVEALATALGRQRQDGLLPEHLLALSVRHMIWWCPAARRRIWFKPDSKHKDADRLKKLNGKVVLHPPLLFHANESGLHLFALKENRRPVAATPLLRAPYWNLSPDGHLCIGSAAIPRELNPALLERYETGFFNSAFSHSNWGHPLTRCPGGHAAHWEAMSHRLVEENNLKYAASLLLPTKRTVQKLITK